MSGSGSGGGAEPDRKRRRILDAGGPIEDDETARRKMRDAHVYERGVRGTLGEYSGFDPDNVLDVKSWLVYDHGARLNSAVKPMGYFARNGDLSMMCWLYVNGADTRDVDVAVKFPMWMAATGRHLEVCQWLFDHGAAKDVKRRTRAEHFYSPNGRSAFSITFGSNGSKATRNITRWLILNGALCKDDESGELDVEIMQQDLGTTSWPVQERGALLEWANNLHRARTSFLLFLSGACITRRSSAPARFLSGKSGVLELIFDYTGGVVRGREAKIICQLTEMLPTIELPVDSDSSAESSSDE